MIGYSCYQRSSLPTTTLKTQARVIHLSSSIMATILIFHLKKNGTHTPDLPQLKDWLWNWGSWWTFVANPFYISKTFRSELMTKEWSHGAMHWVKRSGSIANTSRQWGIENLKSNFSGLSECSTQLGSKYISWNY